MVTDAHVHLLPGRLAQAVRAFFDDLIEQPMAYPLDHDVICASLAADGVDHVWSLPYAHRPGVADGMNASSAQVAAERAAGPVTVTAGCTVHPGDDDPVAVVRRAVEKHGCRVLKLHCSVGDHRPDDPRLDPVWDWVSTIGLPVVVHAGHAVTGHTAADELGPIGEVARRHPGATVIIAHCGHRAVDQALDLVAAHPGVHADLTPVVHDPLVLRADRVEALADKLLFGSDAPNTGFTVGASLARLDALGLTPSARAAVAGGTAERLLGAVRA